MWNTGCLWLTDQIYIIPGKEQNDYLKCHRCGRYILSSSRGARVPRAWLKPTMAVSNTSLRKQTVSKLGCRLIQRIGGSPPNLSHIIKKQQCQIQNKWLVFHKLTHKDQQISKQWMNRFMFIILLINNISPDIFVMASSICWQHTHSLSCWFSQFSQCSQLHQLVFPLLASSFWPSAVFSPSESEKSRMGSKE